MEIIHICFSKNAMASLNIAMKQDLIEKAKIIYLIDDLSNGPIDDMSSIDKRITWHKNFSKDHDVLKQIESNYYNFYSDIESIENEEIHIWYGENGIEMCGLFYALSLLQNNINNIYTVNISEEIHSDNNTIIKHSRVEEISPKRLQWFNDKKKKLKVIMGEQYINSWLNTNLRIIKDKKVISVPEDYFDEIIIYHTKDVFTSYFNVVGNVINNIKNYTSDAFICWRIIELIQNGKIAFIGNTGNILEMKIKRV